MYQINTIPETMWDGFDMSAAAAQMEKAVATVGYGVNAAAYTNLRALGYESLDDMLQSVTLMAKDCALWQALPKVPVHATVDQYNRRTALGSRWGRAMGEAVNPPDTQSTIARAYENIKYYRTKHYVSHVAQLVRNMVNPIQESREAGTNDLIQFVNRDLYMGSSAVFPERTDGIIPTMFASATDNIIDLHGTVLTGREDIMRLAAVVRNKGGQLTNAFCNPLLQADIANAYQSAERIIDVQRAEGGAATKHWIGMTLGGVLTPMGAIAIEGDPFCSEVTREKFPSTGEGTAPTAPTIVSTTPGGSGGNVTNLPTGAYYYKVAGVTELGLSTCATSGIANVTAGQVVTIVITPGDADTTGFWIYRTAKDGAATDCRWLWHVQRAASGNTTFIDNGTHVPGTTNLVFLDLRQNAGAKAIRWSQLFPLTELPLARLVAADQFLLNLYGALRFVAPTWCGLMTNVLTQYDMDAGWNPLGV